jgi:hypothetical protein
MNKSSFLDNTNPFDLADEVKEPQFADEMARACYVLNEDSYKDLETKRMSQFEELHPGGVSTFDWKKIDETFLGINMKTVVKRQLNYD